MNVRRVITMLLGLRPLVLAPYAPRADGNGLLARVPLPPARDAKGVRQRRVVDATNGVSDKIS